MARAAGSAGGASTRFFGRTWEVSSQTPDSSCRKPLEDLVNLRDRITGELARGDPAVVNDLRTQLEKTHRATASSASTSRPESCRSRRTAYALKGPRRLPNQFRRRAD
jgi:hypothetical protein